MKIETYVDVQGKHVVQGIMDVYIVVYTQHVSETIDATVTRVRNKLMELSQN